MARARKLYSLRCASSDAVKRIVCGFTVVMKVSIIVLIVLTTVVEFPVSVTSTLGFPSIIAKNANVQLDIFLGTPVSPLNTAIYSCFSTLK